MVASASSPIEHVAARLRPLSVPGTARMPAAVSFVSAKPNTIAPETESVGKPGAALLFSSHVRCVSMVTLRHAWAIWVPEVATYGHRTAIFWVCGAAAAMYAPKPAP